MTFLKVFRAMLYLFILHIPVKLVEFLGSLQHFPSLGQWSLQLRKPGGHKNTPSPTKAPFFIFKSTNPPNQTTFTMTEYCFL